MSHLRQVNHSDVMRSVRTELSAVGTGLESLGKRHAAMIVTESPFDPENKPLWAQTVRC